MGFVSALTLAALLATAGASPLPRRPTPQPPAATGVPPSGAIRTGLADGGFGDVYGPAAPEVTPDAPSREFDWLLNGDVQYSACADVVRSGSWAPDAVWFQLSGDDATSYWVRDLPPVRDQLPDFAFVMGVLTKAMGYYDGLKWQVGTLVDPQSQRRIVVDLLSCSKYSCPVETP